MKSKRCFSVLLIPDRATLVRMVAIAGFILFQMVSVIIIAQTISISGNVSDGKEPLSDVSVKVRGSSLGSMTDAKGDYNIFVEPDAVLRVELAFEGFRYDDVKRWKIAEQALTLPVSEAIIAKKFVKRNYQFPLPQAEIDRNHGALVQNPDYQ